MQRLFGSDLVRRMLSVLIYTSLRLLFNDTISFGMRHEIESLFFPRSAQSTSSLSLFFRHVATATKT